MYVFGVIVILILVIFRFVEYLKNLSCEKRKNFEFFFFFFLVLLFVNLGVFGVFWYATYNWFVHFGFTFGYILFILYATTRLFEHPYIQTLSSWSEKKRIPSFESSLKACILDAKSTWEFLSPFVLTLGGYASLCFASVELWYLLYPSYVQASILLCFFYVLFISGFFLCLNWFDKHNNLNKNSYKNHSFYKNLFSNANVKDTKIKFQKLNIICPNANKNPFVLFLKGLTFFRSLEYFFVGFGVCSIFYEGGLAFCILTLVYINTLFILILPSVNIFFNKKYCPEALHLLGFNVEIGVPLGIFTKLGPRGVLAGGLICIGCAGVGAIVCNINTHSEITDAGLRNNFNAKTASDSGVTPPPPIFLTKK